LTMVLGHIKGQHFRAHHIDEHARSSWLWRLDARAKLVGVLAFVVTAALMTRPELVLASLCLALLMAASSMIPASHLARAYLTAAPFILIASLSVGLYGGLWKGLAMAARTSACVVALLVLASGTETFALFAGLRRLRVPALVTTLLMLTYKFILLMGEELSRMMVARKARGFRTGRSLADRYGLKVLSYTAGMVLVRASGRADRTFEGLKSRGFEKDFTGWRSVGVRAVDCAFLAVLIAASVSLVLFQLEVVAWPLST
jgi:cobalt/nickel transport system permease protein